MTKEELIKLSRENLRKSKQGSLCECYDEAFIKGYELSKKRIAGLEKENAELKGLVNQYKASKCSGISLFNRNMIMSDQLTKAKEIIKELVRVEYVDFTNGDYSNELSKVLEQAEQFLSEVEK